MRWRGESAKQPTPARGPPPRPPQPPRPGTPGSPARTKPGAGRGVRRGGTETPAPRAQVGTVPGVGAGGGVRSPWRRLPRGRGGPVPERRARLSLWRPRGARGGLRAGPRRGAGERGYGGGARPGAGPGQRDGAGGARGGAPSGAGRPGAWAGPEPAAARAPSPNSPAPGRRRWRAAGAGRGAVWGGKPSRLHSHDLRGRIPGPPRRRPAPGGSTRGPLPVSRRKQEGAECHLRNERGLAARQVAFRSRAPRESPERAGPCHRSRTGVGHRVAGHPGLWAQIQASGPSFPPGFPFPGGFGEEVGFPGFRERVSQHSEWLGPHATAPARTRAPRPLPGHHRQVGVGLPGL